MTAILCISRDVEVENYFASAADSLVALLGETPTAVSIGEAVDRLVQLFQKLRNPPKRSLTGLVGELMVIWAARDPSAAICAWRADTDDRYDFVSHNLRIDAKASSDRRRSHDLSFEQANPPSETIGLLASVWIEGAGGGMSIGDLVAAIEARLEGNHASILRLRSIIADTLGETLPTAMNWCFDLAVATSSLVFFDMRTIPAIRSPLPGRVSGVRFVTDLSDLPPQDMASFGGKIDSAAIALLPATD